MGFFKAASPLRVKFLPKATSFPPFLQTVDIREIEKQGRLVFLNFSVCGSYDFYKKQQNHQRRFHHYRE